MPKNKEDNFPSIRVTEKLREETEKAAEIVDERLSEYIRKSVEERNKKVLKGV
jgi:LytS/YehU family sensor histidine kinase